jgi:hypothetical protein
VVGDIGLANNSGNNCSLISESDKLNLTDFPDDMRGRPIYLTFGNIDFSIRNKLSHLVDIVQVSLLGIPKFKSNSTSDDWSLLNIAHQPKSHITMIL